MSPLNTAYIELLPSDPRHRKVIRKAIQTNDKLSLSALRGNLGKPIHFVTQWFLYYLMQQGNSEREVVTLFSPSIREGMASLLSKRADQVIELGTIPADTYNFLM